MFKAIALQIDIAWEDREETHRRVRALIAKTDVEAGSLLVLPEMFDVGFTMRAAIANDDSQQQTHRFVSQLARENGCAVLAGFVRAESNGRLANVATMFDESGAEIGRYAKTHPFSVAGEDQYYAAGDGPRIIEWKGVRIAPMICYDLRFPELFRLAMKQGAELFPVIANWPIARVEHWTTLVQARAIENLAYVVAVNRCGADPKLTYPGRSRIIDHRGEILADAGEGVGVITAPIDVEKVRRWRADFPVLKDAKLI